MAFLCSNCSDRGVFLVSDPGASEVDYCRRCLPEHLQARADSGHFADSQSVGESERRNAFRFITEAPEPQEIDDTEET